MRNLSCVRRSVASFGLICPRGWLRAVEESLGHGLPAVSVGPHPQGEHGVYTGVVLNGQMSADVCKMRVVGRSWIAGAHAGRRERSCRPALESGFGILPVDLP